MFQWRRRQGTGMLFNRQNRMLQNQKKRKQKVKKKKHEMKIYWCQNEDKRAKRKLTETDARTEIVSVLKMRGSHGKELNKFVENNFFSVDAATVMAYLPLSLSLSLSLSFLSFCEFKHRLRIHVMIFVYFFLLNVRFCIFLFFLSLVVFCHLKIVAVAHLGKTLPKNGFLFHLSFTLYWIFGLLFKSRTNVYTSLHNYTCNSSFI